MSSTKHKESEVEDIEDIVAAWHAYGEQFSVFVRAQQPALSTLEPDMPEFDEKGRRFCNSIPTKPLPELV
jgi:hypothetical protein